jgi:hypothetical protein
VSLEPGGSDSHLCTLYNKSGFDNYMIEWAHEVNLLIHNAKHKKFLSREVLSREVMALLTLRNLWVALTKEYSLCLGYLPHASTHTYFMYDITLSSYSNISSLAKGLSYSSLHQHESLQFKLRKSAISLVPVPKSRTPWCTAACPKASK